MVPLPEASNVHVVVRVVAVGLHEECKYLQAFDAVKRLRIVSRCQILGQHNRATYERHHFRDFEGLYWLDMVSHTDECQRQLPTATQVIASCNTFKAQC